MFLGKEFAVYCEKFTKQTNKQTNKQAVRGKNTEFCFIETEGKYKHIRL